MGHWWSTFSAARNKLWIIYWPSFSALSKLNEAGPTWPKMTIFVTIFVAIFVTIFVLKRFVTGTTCIRLWRLDVNDTTDFGIRTGFGGVVRFGMLDGSRLKFRALGEILQLYRLRFQGFHGRDNWLRARTRHILRDLCLQAVHCIFHSHVQLAWNFAKTLTIQLTLIKFKQRY